MHLLGLFIELLTMHGTHNVKKEKQYFTRKRSEGQTVRKYEQYTVLHCKWLDELHISVNGRATKR